MRTLVLLLLAVFATVGLGCQESGFDERKETARPLKVQHAEGESKVPGQADRPATLTVDSLDDTLALGLRPVRAAVPDLEPPAYLREQAAGVELMRPVGRADLPALEAAAPDLIIGGSEDHGRIFVGLSRIAPTVITEAGGAQWKLNVRLVGEALGRTNDAEALLTDYDRRVAQVRRMVRERAAAEPAAADPPRVAVAREMGGDRLRFATRDSFAGTVLADAGLEQARSRKAADVLLATGPGAAAPAVSSIPAGGSVRRVNDALWWGPGGILAARAALRDLERILGR